jgi:transketolase
MRYKFAELLEQAMEKNKDIFFLTGDLGYRIFDNILQKYPDRAYTVGASEQLMMGMAVGLADSGKMPFVYSITPFLLYRPFEIIRTYINHESCNVKMIGCGRNNDYEHDGFTHFAGDDKEITLPLNNIEKFWPFDNDQLVLNFEEILNNNKPSYLNLTR